MDKGFKLEKRTTDTQSFYAARCLTLGLTAYSDNPNHAWDKLKEMFGVLVDAQRNRGLVEIDG